MPKTPRRAANEGPRRSAVGNSLVILLGVGLVVYALFALVRGFGPDGDAGAWRRFLIAGGAGAVLIAGAVIHGGVGRRRD